MPEVSVIVPARDAQHHLEPLIAPLAEQVAANAGELIIVDNGSRDATGAVAEGAPGVTTVVRRARGSGPGAARNAGAAVASGNVLAFMDADCRPGPGWLAAGVSACTTADLVQGRVLPDPRTPLTPFDRTLSVGAAYGLFETANLFVRRELFERLHGFGAGLEQDDQPFGEDVIFGWRAVRDGARTSFCADALAYHAVIRRSPAEFVAERARLRLFPPLAANVPELREGFFYKRYFHSRRSAAFDLAALGAAGALASGSPLPLAAAAPYLRMLGHSARRWGRRQAGVVALVEAIADCVGAAALVRGSVESGSPVL